jgi:hypothetical protein
MSAPSIQYTPISVFLSASAGLSGDAQYYSKVRYQLPTPLVAPEGYQWEISLRSMSIVNSQLVVNSYNSSLWLTINGGATQVYTVPAGNFDSYSLATSLNSLTGGAGVGWSYDPTTLKMTATCTTGTLVLGGALCTELLDIPLGSSGTSISSSRTVRLTGVQSILVDTDLPGQNMTLRSAGSSATTLARVCNDAEPLATLHYQSSESGNLLYDSSVYSFTISLTDEFGRPLLATCPYEMSLEFAQKYTGRLSLNILRPYGLAAYTNQQEQSNK